MTGAAAKIDQVTALRAARKSLFPDPVTAAALAELAGADGISVRLRRNRRYINGWDVRIFRSII